MAVILGGGLSGLSAAYYLKKCGHISQQNKLYIIEALKKCGGWIQTSKGKDFVFEMGPRTIRPVAESGRNTLKLVEEIGLSDMIIPISLNDTAAKNRMIYVKGELHSLPRSFFSLFTVNKPFTKAPIAALLQDILVTAPVISAGDDSIYNFVHRRFGEEIAEYAISPLICGICAGDAKEISVKFLMKRLFEYEQKYGGVAKGLVRSMFQKENQSVSGTISSALAKRAESEEWASYSFKGGMQTLPDQLQSAVLDDQCHLYSNLKAVKLKFYSFKGGRKASFKLSNGITCVANHLYSSLPAFELGTLMEEDHPYLAKLLHEIAFVTVGVVNLKYSAPNLLPKPGFGFLVPPSENLPVLGCIFDSCCFPNENSGTVITVMMGGKWFRERCGENVTESDLLKIAQENVKNILGIWVNPEAYKVSIQRNCIPQYTVGHYDRVQKIRNYINDKNLPLTVFGASYDGVGINDVIMSAKTAVENTLENAE